MGGIGTSPLSLYVPAASPWRTVADLVADAKRQPGKLNCGSGNAVTQVACEVFRKSAGIQTTNVPYKSNPQSLTDVVGGQLAFAFSDGAAAPAYVEGTRLRAIGVAKDRFEKAARQPPAAGLRRHIEIIQQPAPPARDRLRQVEHHGEGHQLAIHETGRIEHHIVEMLPAGLAMVHDEDVAGLQLRAKLGELGRADHEFSVARLAESAISVARALPT